jgi:hypothetical protein
MSRGVFRIIGGRGAFITALFEETFGLYDFWVNDTNTIVFSELANMSDVFSGFVPTEYSAQAAEMFGLQDSLIDANDTFEFETESFDMQEVPIFISPTVHNVVAEAVFNRMSDDVRVPAANEFNESFDMQELPVFLTPTVHNIPELNIIGVSDAFDAIIE